MVRKEEDEEEEGTEASELSWLELVLSPSLVGLVTAFVIVVVVASVGNSVK